MEELLEEILSFPCFIYIMSSGFVFGQSKHVLKSVVATFNSWGKREGMPIEELVIFFSMKKSQEPSFCPLVRIEKVLLANASFSPQFASKRKATTCYIFLHYYCSVFSNWECFIKMRAAFFLSPSFINRGRNGATLAALILWTSLNLIGHHSTEWAIL